MARMGKAAAGQGRGERLADSERTYDWRSPVSFTADVMTKVVREALDEGGYKYTRDSGERPYSKFAIIIPLPKFAYVYKYVVEEPIEVVIGVYDTKPTHSGVITYFEIADISEEGADQVKELLRAICAKLPRPPWRFTFGQKLQYALVATEYHEAKRAWKAMGFRTK